MNDNTTNLVTNTLSSILGFNSERIDSMLRNYHLGNGYRLYNPSLRRFTSPDSQSPFGQGGINPYAYCEGNPISNVDPTGHFGLSIISQELINAGIFASNILIPGIVSSVEAGTETIGCAVERNVVRRESNDLDEALSVKTSSHELKSRCLVSMTGSSGPSTIELDTVVPITDEQTLFSEGIKTVYRWDSRPPRKVLKYGFEGIGDNPDSGWWHKIFGHETVYTSKDLNGTIDYLRLLKMSKRASNNKEIYYLYKINTKDMRYVDVNLDSNRRAHFGEVQICGPVNPNRIEFILSKKLKKLPDF